MRQRSDIATSKAGRLFVQTQAAGFWAGVEDRVQVKAERSRVPDVTIVRGAKPSGRIISAPPEVAVSTIQQRIDDYVASGVPCLRVTRRAWVHTSEALREAEDGVLRNVEGDLAVSLTAIFVD